MIHKLQDKDTSQQTTLKDAFAKGAKPKTISQEPSLTKEAPKLANESSTDEVKGNPTEMPRWRKLNKKQIVETILELFGNAKTANCLMEMTTGNLMIYVQSKVSVKVDNADKLVKTPNTMKPSKGKAQGRNKGVTA